MYIPAHFRVDDPALLLPLIERYGFATLVTVEEGSPFATHLPLLLRRGPDRLVGHMARANPQWRGLAQQREVLALFQGPHAYVSPSWYASAPNVPTWNYAVVHAYGEARLIEEPAQVHALLQDTVTQYESGRERPWRLEEAADYAERLVKGIVAFELRLTRLEGKFKLSQNKGAEDRAGVIAALEASEDPLERELARMMRRVG
ncbi:FMN-binding negative transcriptional regulator [Aggregicoccus sp. 17bor-14]|uniref:FMN-binding negative transcriptional regulator n=1 Tax=Myxococcaceae TaxID=31 RepID=UPI00129C3B72|nr:MULTISPECIES: FMN-binding negative transcriptional regulator [Myxococcaceae]MBF5046082.1 FMN-binding negative transcriptional regulator [Simulacricoccus sp. 17bor-14]MRI91811.1 FMN-binding negative transcriptional regulator [Aggregicoccus sp. 17bor-14]